MFTLHSFLSLQDGIPNDTVNLFFSSRFQFSNNSTHSSASCFCSHFYSSFLNVRLFTKISLRHFNLLLLPVLSFKIILHTLHLFLPVCISFLFFNVRLFTTLSLRHFLSKTKTRRAVPPSEATSGGPRAGGERDLCHPRVCEAVRGLPASLLLCWRGKHCNSSSHSRENLFIGLISAYNFVTSARLNLFFLCKLMVAK